MKSNKLLIFFLILILSISIVYASEIIWLEEEERYEWNGSNISVESVSSSGNKCNVIVNGVSKWIEINEKSNYEKISVRVLDTIQISEQNLDSDICELHFNFISEEEKKDIANTNKTIITVRKEINIEIGKNGNVPIIVTNQGNYNRDYELSLSHLEGKADYFFEPSSYITIQPGLPYTINLTITPLPNSQETDIIYVLSIISGNDTEEIPLILNILENEEIKASRIRGNVSKFLFIFLLLIVFSLVNLVVWFLMIIDCIQRKFKRKFLWLLLLNLIPLSNFVYLFIVKIKNIGTKEKIEKIGIESLISFILGTMSIMSFPYLGSIVGIPSIIFGVIAKRKYTKLNNELILSNVGIILGVVATLLQFLIIIAYFGFLISVVTLAGID